MGLLEFERRCRFKLRKQRIGEGGVCECFSASRLRCKCVW